ncbi:HEPN domain protein [Methanothrix harundinacea 6Ac]|uniref:HEPN domain protein n=1 Tax=Methanothrix harundinacea (strain 6Ac) TaxID=1110509 RepID=G7WPX0_METH6|nr:HEPN domain protein [Methanothrix harundinacea 6Ac]
MLSSRSGWNTLIRYSPAGSISQAKSKEWLKEADTIYNSVVVPMRLDGVI